MNFDKFAKQLPYQNRTLQSNNRFLSRQDF